MVGIEFVEVEAVGFPVFVQAEGEVEGRLRCEPARVGEHFRRDGRVVFAVEVDAAGVFAAVEREASRVEAWAQPEVRVGGPVVLFQ